MLEIYTYSPNTDDFNKANMECKDSLIYWKRRYSVFSYLMTTHDEFPLESHFVLLFACEGLLSAKHRDEEEGS